MSNRGHDFKRYVMLALVGASFLSFSQQPQQSIHDPALTTPPDKNKQIELQQDPQKMQSFEAANFERKRQIADDTTKLLELATQLKDEVDKTSKDTLSLNVIKKADSIEKLAHGVREKMKLSMASN